MRAELDKLRSYQKITHREFLIFFILPALVLVTIQYLVPYPVKKEYFILNAAHPTLSALFLTNYVHIDAPTHLWGNVFTYELVMFYIFMYSTNKREIYISSALFFFVLPFLISFASLAALRGSDINTLGFSGIVAAFIGYFIYVYYRFVKIEYISKLNYSFVVTVALVNFGIMIVKYYHSLMLWVPIIVILAVVYFYLNRSGIKEAVQLHKSRRKLTPLSFIYYFFAFFLLFSAFPSIMKPPTEEDFNNIIAHFAGYISGILIPLVLFEPYYHFKGGARDA